MGVSPAAEALEEHSSASGSGDEASVTAVGEQALVRAAALEIVRGTVLAGRYQVEAVIGRGGSGFVLRAFDRVAQTPVAVKILKPDLAADPRWIDRFTRELRLARQLQHPNVCRVFDIGQADGHWFITMELAPCGTLREQLVEHAPPRPFSEKLADIRAVVAGLAAIHEAGIVHRDVKPDNFLRMDEGRLVLSDFGLATNPAEATTVSILVGTPSYMAPEVVLGAQATFQSDVWSLGVVLHELVFGKRPEWSTSSPGRALVPQPTRGLANAERSLALFVEECLHVDLTIRPANAVEARRKCEEALRSKPPLWRATRRHRARWIWPALAAVGAIAAGAAGSHLWQRAKASSTFVGAATTPSFQGTAADWTEASDVIASFKEPVHCLEWFTPDRMLRVVLGAPRRVIDVDVSTKRVQADALPATTFALGCPQRSKRGELLFEAFDDVGRRQIMLARSETDVAHARALTIGREPLWLPSGTEFVYTADEAHAALFSIPVMGTNIITEAQEEAGLLVGKAVRGDGSAVALRYVDASMKRHVVTHELPSLAAVDRATFDSSPIDFTFSGPAGGLLFSMKDARGRILASLELGAKSALRLGAVPGRDLRMPTPGHGLWAFVAQHTAVDVWEQEGGARRERLTHDGRSSYPDLSANGDLIVEQLGPDGSTIQLYEKGSTVPRQVSSGPRDLTPSFLPDGHGWLYVDGERKVIRRCERTGACTDVKGSDGDYPVLPVASPDGDQIAYVTAIGRERLKVLSPAGDIRDLGPTRAACAPFWTPSGQIWFMQGSDETPLWVEVDVKTGEQIRTWPVSANLGDEFDCSVLNAPPGVARPPRAVAVTSDSVEIRTLPSQQGFSGQIP